MNVKIKAYMDNWEAVGNREFIRIFPSLEQISTQFKRFGYTYIENITGIIFFCRLVLKRDTNA